MKSQKIITRFAPSPTGYLHIGGLRTALYAYLFARAQGGQFLLRIEDTDRNRYVEGAEEKLQESLQWAGIHWDNDVIFHQSERLEVYKKYVDQLLAEGKAYRCFCSPERLEEMRKTQQKHGEAPKYDRTCHSLSLEDVKRRLDAGEAHVVRFFVPEEPSHIEFIDAIRGKTVVNTKLIDDQVILKSDGFPTYHLASVVDDHESDITHVIRGEEWLPSTPKHILLYRAFGWEIPVFAHLSLLLNSDRSKLSKRQGDVSVDEYAKKGYLPEALINYVVLLGWNPGSGSTEEFFTMEELERRFDIADINKAGAVFDLKRLDWMNAHYIKMMDVDTLYEKTRGYLEAFFSHIGVDTRDFDREYLLRVLEIERERLTTLSDVGKENVFFFKEVRVEKDLLRFRDVDDENIFKNLTRAREKLESMPSEDWTRDNLEKVMLSGCEEDKKGEYFWPLRVALTGEKKSPPPHEVAWVIGKESTLKRLQSAIDLFS